IGVVGERDGALEQLRQIAVERLAVQPCGIRVLEQPGRRGYGAWRAEADRAVRAEFGFGLGDQVANRAKRRIVTALRARPPAAQQHAAMLVEGDDLDFGAAEIDTERDRHAARISNAAASARPGTAAAPIGGNPVGEAGLCRVEPASGHAGAARSPPTKSRRFGSTRARSAPVAKIPYVLLRRPADGTERPTSS